MNLSTAFTKEFREILRTRRFLIALIILLFFGITSPLLAKLMPEIFARIPGTEAIALAIPAPTLSDAVTQYLKNISQFGMLLVLLFAMGSVAAEKDKGTAVMILTKPMPRSSFILAKFLALALTFAVALAAAGAFAYFYTVLLFGKTSLSAWLAMNGLIWLYLLVYAALTVFYSTLTKTQYIAIGLSFATLIVLGIAASLPGVGGYLPDSLLANAGGIALGVPYGSWTGLWISLGVITAALAGACFVFRGQEL